MNRHVTVKPKNKHVTVVVPVYGDWKSLSGCIDSIIDNVGAHHRVLFVNDCGPEVDVLEKNIKAKIMNHKNFQYFRNSKNLGFVQTCNRAVLELDKTDNDILLLNSDTIVTEGFLEEMTGVLYANDHHGVVVPRSNNATLASVPLRQLHNRGRDNLEYSYSVWQKIKNDLPRYSVIPVGVGFCLLIKRDIIKNFGLFDEVFGKGYNEENDFCLRINQYGYSSVMANQAFVYHLESKSFGEELKNELEQRNHAVLIKRYSYYPLVIERYFSQFIDPVDYFADAIAGVDHTKKVLINLYHFPAVFNGSTKNGTSFLKYLKSQNLDKNKVEITILANPETADFHKLTSYGFRVVYPNILKDEIFDVGYCPMQIFHFENLAYLNRHCLRVVFAMLDIISLRSQYLLTTDIRQRAVILDSIRLADKVITISDATKHDVAAYFNACGEYGFDAKAVTIQQGLPGASFASPDKSQASKSDYEEYVLIFGNDYKHKAIKECVEAVRDTNHNFVVLGPRQLASSARNVTVMPSGSLSDKEVETLIKKSQMVIFPSLYEGFGFPILEAASYHKPLIYSASEVGIEIAKLTAGHNRSHSYKEFSEIPNLISELLSDKKVAKPKSDLRQLDDYNHETWKLLNSLLKMDYKSGDIKHLRERWHYFSSASEYYYSDQRESQLHKRIQSSSIRFLKQYPGIYNRTRDVYRKLK